MIHSERVQALNDEPINKSGKYVLYWMQASQWAVFNHALEFAVAQSNELKLPVIVCFGLMDDYPEANERHYAFMLQGLADVRERLQERGIKFVVKHGAPPDVAMHYACDAALLICDRGYLLHQKAWRDQVADHAGCRVVQVETDVVVPADEVSDHAEFAARTIRPKIHKQLARYLVPLDRTLVERPSLRMRISGDIDVSNPAATLAQLRLDRSVGQVSRFVGGTTHVLQILDRFIRANLPAYSQRRNEPAAGATSPMSAYLHFGQISPLQIALAVRDGTHAAQENRDAYLEELIVRRELSINYCHFNPKYDRYEGLPEWARKTLSEHRNDKRYRTYTRAQLEAAATDDPYWNAAQQEMNKTGFMHNYMRMYWGKRILEWSRSPQEAFATTLYLNNKLFLCGRDPNGYAGVGWIFGLHDRPWGPAKPVFGTVRTMTASGLERKFDMQAYLDQVAQA